MRRRLALAIAFIGVLGLLGLSPTAQADHDGGAKNAGKHENSPAPPVPVVGVGSGACVVTGTVNIDDGAKAGGVDLVPQPVPKNHNHFKFEDAAISCVDGPVDGNFDVEAAGGTDGPGECDGLPGKDPKCPTNHGEDVSAGWSHSDCYAGDCDLNKLPKDIDDIYSGTNVNPAGTTQCNNCGEIWVENPDTDETSDQDVDPFTNPDTELSDNWLKFCRGVYNDDVNGNSISDIEEAGGTCSNVGNGGENFSRNGGNVLAWGALQNWSHDKPLVVCFLADLEFTPSPENLSGTKVKRAVLEGTAVTWTVPDKDDCHGKKNSAKSPG